jgi:hypothetical protein
MRLISFFTFVVLVSLARRMTELVRSSATIRTGTLPGRWGAKTAINDLTTSVANAD